MNFKQMALLIGFLGGVGCGSAAPSPELAVSESLNDSDSGSAQLNIVLPPAPYRVSKAIIASFEVTVGESDTEPQFQKTLSADAKGLLLENLPLGVGRSLAVKAFNDAGELLRIGKIDNMMLEQKKETSLNLKLEAVPLVLNLREGQPLSNARLFFRLYADPEQELQIEQNGKVIGRSITDERGIAALYYPGLSAGEYPFTIRNLANDLTSTLNLKVWEGNFVSAAPLGAASGGAGAFGQPFLSISKTSEVLWE